MYCKLKSIKPFLFASALILTSCSTLMLKVMGEYPTIEIENGAAKINGTLGKQFHKKFEKFIEENPEIKDLILENIPGSINDEWNVKTCRLVHQNCMNTTVNSTSNIASGGVDLFISGNNRVVIDGAQIGVHSWRDLKQDGSEYPKNSEEHEIFLEFFDEIGIDTSFYWYTLQAAKGKDIHWMTPEEIKIYGLKMTIDSTNTCFK